MRVATSCPHTAPVHGHTLEEQPILFAIVYLAGFYAVYSGRWSLLNWALRPTVWAAPGVTLPSQVELTALRVLRVTGSSHRHSAGVGGSAAIDKC